MRVFYLDYILAGLPGPKNKKDIFGQNRQFQKCLFSENILNFSQIFPNQASKSAIF